MTSTNGEIEIKAPSQITLIAGDTKIELNGANVTLSTSGELNLKGALKQVAKELSGGTSLPVLPQGVVTVPQAKGMPNLALEKPRDTKLHDEAFLVKDKVSGEAIKNRRYRIRRANGNYEYGTTDANGLTHIVLSGSTAEALSIEIWEA